MKTNLSALSDQDLCSKTVSLAAEERRITAELLRHLAEIERRQLHLGMGFPSIYAFLVKHLRYSEGAAGRRLQALRLMQGLHEDARTQTMSKIESGDVTLSTLSTVQNFLRAEKKEGKTYTPAAKERLLAEIEGKSQREVEYQLAEISPRVIPREIERPITGTQTQIQFVADQELMGKLQRLRELFSHKNPNPTYAELFELMAERLLKQMDPARRVATPSATGAEYNRPLSRYLPSDVQRSVWIRDRGACTFYDPRRAWSKGGTHAADNLALRCKAHNLHAARTEFGEAKIEAEIQAVRRRAK